MPFLVIRLSDTDAAAVVGQVGTTPDAVDLIKRDMKSSSRENARYLVAGGNVDEYTAKRSEVIDVQADS